MFLFVILEILVWNSNLYIVTYVSEIQILLYCIWWHKSGRCFRLLSNVIFDLFWKIRQIQITSILMDIYFFNWEKSVYIYSNCKRIFTWIWKIFSLAQIATWSVSECITQNIERYLLSLCKKGWKKLRLYRSK